MPRVAISTDFLTALARVPRAQQKKVRSFVTRFQIDPTAASINYEPIHNVRDDRVRTVRIDLAYRAIVLHPDKGDIYVLLWIDHHDEAMDWARNKRFEINPVTGSLQVLDTDLIADAMGGNAATSDAGDGKSLDEYALFETFTDDDLLRTGLPTALLPAVRVLKAADDLEQLRPYLPEEAYEALFWIAHLGYSVDQALAEAAPTKVHKTIDTEDLAAALEQPDSRRRFALVDSAAELAEILNAPLEKWRIFLHPSQAALVHRHFNGPARVLGGAGTGKTVVAMHRARYLAREVFTAPNDRILFTTYTHNLANNIKQNLNNLCGPERERIEVVNLHRWAVQFLRGQGLRYDIATNEEIDECWGNAVRVADTLGLSDAFYSTEWRDVVQAQSIVDRAAYLRVSRRGRGVSLSRPQRAAIWPVFEEFRQMLAELGKIEWFDLIQQTRLYLAEHGDLLPYRAIIVDETQDLHPEELRLLRQMAPEGQNDLFFVGDAHQRIYGRPVVMSHQGINIRGRSRKLRINYRTTEEIRNWSVGVLTGQAVDDLDGGIDEHRDYLSLMHGISPEACHFETSDAEADHLVEVLAGLLEIAPAESICLVARTHGQLVEGYIPVLQGAGIDYLYLQADTAEYGGSGIRIATMHRVKGLEFAHVVIAGINDSTMPLLIHPDEMDSAELAEAELRERCLLHVASSRARETLSVSGYGTPSRFLDI